MVEIFGVIGFVVILGVVVKIIGLKEIEFGGFRITFSDNSKQLKK